MNVGIAGAGSIVPRFWEAKRGIADLQAKAICAPARSRERIKKRQMVSPICRFFVLDSDWSYTDALIGERRRQTKKEDVFLLAAARYKAKD